MADNDCLVKIPFLTVPFLLLFFITIIIIMQMKGTHNPSVPPTAEASAITRVADFDVSLMSWLVRVG